MAPIAFPRRTRPRRTYGQTVVEIQDGRPGAQPNRKGRGPYVVLCVTHLAQTELSTQAEALRWAARPQDFCPECEDQFP
jgi:hypothetical protein